MLKDVKAPVISTKRGDGAVQTGSRKTGLEGSGLRPFAQPMDYCSYRHPKRARNLRLFVHKQAPDSWRFSIKGYVEILAGHQVVNILMVVVAKDGSGFSGSNLLGFNGREAKLADRVREVEEQNQLLRRQLRYDMLLLLRQLSSHSLSVTDSRHGF